MAEELLIRRAAAPDAAAIADVYLTSFRAALPTVRLAHTDDECRAWLAEVVVPHLESWVAEAGGSIVAMMVLAEGWIEQLYVAPDWRGRGLGDRLVALAKGRQPAGL